MAIWASYYFRGYETISVHVLPNIVLGSFVLFMTARAVAIVVQYRLQDAGKGA